MQSNPEWLFDESAPAGIDYTDPAVTEGYDAQHEGFRDFQREAQQVGEVLGLSEESVVLDIGCGTGSLSIHLARVCKHIYAVDASASMLERLKQKISQAGLSNVTPVCAGFLTYEHNGLGPDAIISTVALHHLPDFWKQIALCRLHGMLKPGGKLFLVDVVFSFSPEDHGPAIDGWIGSMRAEAGEQMAQETVAHVRKEFSTWAWIMEGMLDRAGFIINNTTERTSNVRTYVCSKPS